MKAMPMKSNFCGGQVATAVVQLVCLDPLQRCHNLLLPVLQAVASGLNSVNYTLLVGECPLNIVEVRAHMRQNRIDLLVNWIGRVASKPLCHQFAVSGELWALEASIVGE